MIIFLYILFFFLIEFTIPLVSQSWFSFSQYLYWCVSRSISIIKKNLSNELSMSFFSSSSMLFQFRFWISSGNICWLKLLIKLRWYMLLLLFVLNWSTGRNRNWVSNQRLMIQCFQKLHFLICPLKRYYLLELLSVRWFE